MLESRDDALKQGGVSGTGLPRDNDRWRGAGWVVVARTDSCANVTAIENVSHVYI